METTQRSAPRRAPLRRIELAGYALVAIGFALMALGILEIGGVFNIGLGLALVVAGTPMMFARDDAPELDEEEFMRQLDDL